MTVLKLTERLGLNSNQHQSVQKHLLKLKQAATIGQGIMKMMAFFTTENLNVSLHISRKNHSQKMSPFPSESSQHNGSNLINPSQAAAAAAARCSLQTLSADSLMPASVARKKSLSQIQNPHVPLYKFRLRFLCFTKGNLLPDFHQMLKDRLLVIEVQQPKKSSAFASMKLRSTYNITGFGRKRRSVRNNKR